MRPQQSRSCATHDSATRKTKRPYKEESEGRGDAARAAGPGPSERPGRTGRTPARVSAARSSSTRAAATSTSMFARGVAVWGAEKHFFNLRSASRGHFRSIPERLSERNEQDAAAAAALRHTRQQAAHLLLCATLHTAVGPTATQRRRQPPNASGVAAGRDIDGAPALCTNGPRTAAVVMG